MIVFRYSPLELLACMYILSRIKFCPTCQMTCREFSRYIGIVWTGARGGASSSSGSRSLTRKMEEDEERLESLGKLPLLKISPVSSVQTKI
jgi:hypothetical protein